MKTAVIIGSTGLTGSLLVKKLVLEGSFGQIIAICRNKNTVEQQVFSSPKVRLLEFSFQNWSELEIQIKSYVGTSQSTFFCCLGTTIKKAGSQEAFRRVDHDYFVNFAKLARACRAEQLIIISGLGADKNSNVFYSRTKGEMEENVRNAYSGTLHILRPSLLLGDRKDFRFSERVLILLSPAYSMLLLGGLKKYQPVTADQVVKTMFLLAEKRLSAGLVLENQDILKT